MKRLGYLSCRIRHILNLADCFSTHFVKSRVLLNARSVFRQESLTGAAVCCLFHPVVKYTIFGCPRLNHKIDHWGGFRWCQPKPPINKFPIKKIILKRPQQHFTLVLTSIDECQLYYFIRNSKMVIVLSFIYQLEFSLGFWLH